MNELNEVIIFQKKSLDAMGVTENGRKHVLENIEMARQITERAMDSFNGFFDIVLGSSRYSFPNMSSMFFPQRFLKVVDTSDLGKEKYDIIDNILEKCFFLGFIYHFAYYNFPTRANIKNVNFDELVDNWLPHTLVANMQMKEYAKENDGLSEKYFTMFYKEQNFKTIIKDNFKIGFFNSRQTTSFFNNIFYCGAMYAMNYDMATKQHTI